MFKLSKINIQKLILLLYAFTLFIIFHGKIFFIGAHLLLIIIFFLSLLTYKLDNFFVKKPNILLLPLTLFCIQITIGILYTNAVNYGSYKVLLFISIVIPSLLISGLTLKLNKYIFVSIIFLMLAVFNEFGSPLSILNDITPFYRLGSEDNNSIVLSRGLGLGFISGLFLLKPELSKIKKIMIFMIIFLFFIYMILTGSKGPIIALLISLIFYFLFNPYKKKIINNKYVLLVFIMLGFLMVKYLRLILSAFDFTFIENRTKGGSFSSRLELYEILLNDFYNSGVFNLLFGKGTGNYGFLFSGMDQAEYPHNMILEVLYENGIIGLIILLTIIFVLLISFFKKKIIKGKMYLFVICIYFLINSFMTADIAGNIFFFIFGYFALSRNTRLSLNDNLN
jgi:hypothetical protein